MTEIGGFLAQDAEQKKQLAAERTKEAQITLDQRSILDHAPQIADPWEWLKDTTAYPIPRPSRPTSAREPIPPDPIHMPKITDPRFHPRPSFIDRILPGFLDTLIPSRLAARTAASEAAFGAAHDHWEETTKKRLREYETRLALFKSQAAALSLWQEGREQYLRDQERANAEIDWWR